MRARPDVRALMRRDAAKHVETVVARAPTQRGKAPVHDAQAMFQVTDGRVDVGECLASGGTGVKGVGEAQDASRAVGKDGDVHARRVVARKRPLWSHVRDP